MKKRGKKLFKASLASSFSEKARGLMFSRKAFPILFEFSREGTWENSIHSFFCPRFDAVFLDKQKRVVSVEKNIRPFRFFIVSEKPCKFLLELPPGWGGKFVKGEKIGF